MVHSAILRHSQASSDGVDNGSEKKQAKAEVEEMAEWARAVLAFINSVGAVPMYEQYQKAIDGCASRGDARGMKGVVNDFSEWVKDMSPEAQARLDAHLREKLGKGLSAWTDKKKLAKLLERGAIKTENEYRQVLAFVEENHRDPSQSDAVDRANAALAVFHTQKKS
jgi:hypothetical protein